MMERTRTCSYCGNERSIVLTQVCDGCGNPYCIRHRSPQMHGCPSVRHGHVENPIGLATYESKVKRREAVVGANPEEDEAAKGKGAFGWLGAFIGRFVNWLKGK